MRATSAARILEQKEWLQKVNQLSILFACPPCTGSLSTALCSSFDHCSMQDIHGTTLLGENRLDGSLFIALAEAMHVLLSMNQTDRLLPSFLKLTVRAE